MKYGFIISFKKRHLLSERVWVTYLQWLIVSGIPNNVLYDTIFQLYQGHTSRDDSLSFGSTFVHAETSQQLLDKLL